MEAKLAEYRARKAKEAAKQSRDDTSIFSNIFKRNKCDPAVSDNSRSDNSESTKHENSNEDQSFSANSCVSGSNNANHNSINTPEPDSWDNLTILQVSLKVFLWFVVWGLFIELEFGAVYFVLSAVILLYMSMRAGTRQKNKLSAYSVFNPNFERLDGTFTAEQFEKELRYGPSAVK